MVPSKWRCSSVLGRRWNQEAVEASAVTEGGGGIERVALVLAAELDIVADAAIFFFTDGY